ncbi:MAG: Serine-tRNA ligase [Candidatus Magasanikbacteria bacterium GW2011_GWC2_37_14]|uniref:Serine--tRNA ligase n=1 Tax=Candidatus Magasanikbacteria bacterium GW2011_GWC2_37_14 TaxID=1619046 RepID=A0A0G0GDR1_9BACT|nr:MAG: Serine-tRNA ligase [Candidatus Magasanikbacteria bacterium GW2011_GWC2_37_14]
MLDIKFIRENVELIKTNCANRHVKVDIEKLVEFDDKRRGMLKRIEDLRASRNQNSKQKPSEEEIAKMKIVGEGIKALEVEMQTIDAEYLNLLKQIPNLSHPESPIGGEADYKVICESGKPPKFDFVPKDHETLMTSLDLIDFERGAKVSGSKFYFVKNDAVRLNFALLSYGMDIVNKYGYTLMETPDLAKNEILSGTGYNPRGNETAIYSVENTDLSLIATAEITVGGYHANEVLDLSSGPKKYVALSHCFRTEAGSYGQESKGLYRVHQFTKLEMFVFCKPEESEKYHEEILNIEKEICDGLKLNYRVIDIPTGDLGGPAYRKFDLEAWMVMKDGYGEITSTSNCTDYQARRLNIKYKNEQGNNEYVHTLNGTAVVLSRFPLSIVEQYQQADGSVKIPAVLVKYLGKKIIK